MECNLFLSTEKKWDVMWLLPSSSLQCCRRKGGEEFSGTMFKH